MHSVISINQERSEHATIIQITDTHIQADPDDDFDGVNTRESLHKVLNFIQEHEEQYDAMLVTGDLVHDPVEEAYQALCNQLMEMPGPVFCIPGNHDDPGLMEQHMNADNISTAKSLNFENWQICMLNTWMPGTHAGELSKEELDFLDNLLREGKDKYSLLALHHPPVSIDSPWMDRMGLCNPDEFFSVIDRYDNVRAVIWGHIHQEFERVRNNVYLQAAPSTCVQFMPRADHYQRDEARPGYRILKLHKGGQVESTVKRVGRLAT